MMMLSTAIVVVLVCSSNHTTSSPNSPHEQVISIAAVKLVEGVLDVRKQPHDHVQITFLAGRK